MNYRKGQTVRSVAGIFTEGVIEDIIDEETVKVRWLQHIDKGTIDFVQVRSTDIIKPFWGNEDDSYKMW